MAPMSPADVQETRELDPRQFRAANEVKIPIGGGWHVVCQKLDMPTMVLEGITPMPLLTAVQKMLANPDSTDAERVGAVSPEEKLQMLEMLRHHACSAALRPRLTATDTGNPSEMPVVFLGLDTLMAIWKQTAIIPLMGAADAARFRERVDHDDVPAGQVREEVPPAAEPLAGVEFRSA